MNDAEREVKCPFMIEDGAGHYCNLLPMKHTNKMADYPHSHWRVMCFGKQTQHCDGVKSGMIEAIQRAEQRGRMKGEVTKGLQAFPVVLEEKEKSFKEGLLRGAEIAETWGEKYFGIDIAEAIRKEASTNKLELK